jgi:hypothetical protein
MEPYFVYVIPAFLRFDVLSSVFTLQIFQTPYALLSPRHLPNHCPDQKYLTTIPSVWQEEILTFSAFSTFGFSESFFDLLRFALQGFSFFGALRKEKIG